MKPQKNFFITKPGFKQEVKDRRDNMVFLFLSKAHLPGKYPAPNQPATQMNYLKGIKHTFQLTTIFCTIFLFTAFCINTVEARISDPSKIHPINIELLKAGILKTPPKYNPNVPRITAQQAYALYQAQRAVFVLNSSHDGGKIFGGYWMKEIKNKVDINKLVKKDQILIFY